MDNKFNNMINEFLQNTEAKDEEELNVKLQEFITQYNNGMIEYENTPLDNAYELLEQAENAKTKKQALKLAKEAYKLCPECLDAILFQANLEEDSLKRDEIINEGIKREEKRLKKEKYFDKENIGHFYGIFETRPYIRGLYDQANYFLFDGKIKQARDICKEILKLNENDNMGVRYLLMAIYAYLEEEKDMLKLYDKYKEENLEMLFPIFTLYYKLGDTKKADIYLKRINEANQNFIKFVKGNITLNKEIPQGYYQEGDASEVIMYFEKYDFLINTMPNLDNYILKNN